MSVHTIKSPIYDAFVEKAPRQMPGSDYYVTDYFINNSESTLVVLQRGNFPVTLYPVRHDPVKPGELIIRTVHFFAGLTKAKETLQSMNDMCATFHMTDPNYLELKALLEKKICEHSGANGFVLSFDRHVRVSDIRKTGSLYDPDADTLIVYQDNFPHAIHPECAEARNMTMVERAVNGKIMAGVLIEVIDNENNIGPRYIYCAKEVVEVTPHRCAEMASGVYVTHVERVDETDSVESTIFYTFDQAQEAIGLWATREQAQSAGNVEHLIKEKQQENANKGVELNAKAIEARAAQLEREAALERARAKAEEERRESERKRSEEAREAERKLSEERFNNAQREAEFRHEMEKKEAKMKKRLDKIKFKAAKAKEKLMVKASKLAKKGEVRKDFYEERSHHRKDTSEIFKFIPTFLAGAALIFAVFK